MATRVIGLVDKVVESKKVEVEKPKTEKAKKSASK